MTNLMTLLIIGALPVKANAIDFPQQKFKLNSQGLPCGEILQEMTDGYWHYKCVDKLGDGILTWQKSKKAITYPTPCNNPGETMQKDGYEYRCTAPKGVGSTVWKKARKLSWSDYQPKSQEVKKLQKNNKKAYDIRKKMKRKDKSYNYNLAPGY